MTESNNFIPKINLDLLPDNRLWLAQWDAPYSPESPEGIAWGIGQGWDDADAWRASDLYRRGLAQFVARQATKEGEAG